MATTENIVDAFDDLGFTLEDSRVIDRLVSRYCNLNFIKLNVLQVEIFYQLTFWRRIISLLFIS